MSRKVLGRAEYSAYRLERAVTLVAKGEYSNLNEKSDFEQLPFRIFPPIYGFYLIIPEIVLPAMVPFVYKEQISFPESAETIGIQDAEGFHHVPISQVAVPDFQASAAVGDTSGDFCVYKTIGINSMMVDRCGLTLPPGFESVYGPDSYEKCQEYSKAHGGL